MEKEWEEWKKDFTSKEIKFINEFCIIHQTTKIPLIGVDGIPAFDARKLDYKRFVKFFQLDKK